MYNDSSYLYTVNLYTICKYAEGLEDGAFNIQSSLSMTVLFVCELNYMLLIIQNNQICEHAAQQAQLGDTTC